MCYLQFRSRIHQNYALIADIHLNQYKLLFSINRMPKKTKDRTAKVKLKKNYCQQPSCRMNWSQKPQLQLSQQSNSRLQITPKTSKKISKYKQSINKPKKKKSVDLYREEQQIKTELQQIDNADYFTIHQLVKKALSQLKKVRQDTTIKQSNTESNRRIWVLMCGLLRQDISLKFLKDPKQMIQEKVQKYYIENRVEKVKSSNRIDFKRINNYFLYQLKIHTLRLLLKCKVKLCNVNPADHYQTCRNNFTKRILLDKFPKAIEMCDPMNCVGQPRPKLIKQNHVDY